MNLDLNVYTVLVTKYKRKYELPQKWEEMDDIKIKIELLSQALNREIKIEELKIYQKIIEEQKND